MSWEIRGTTGSLESFPHVPYKSMVCAPKNPKLIRNVKKNKKITPSEFLKEMSLDTKQKLANTHEMHLPQVIELLDMGETSLQKNTELMIDEPMFQPYPSEIYFQKYEAFETYEVPLILRNNDKVPRLVKVTQLDTPYFKIIASSEAHQKIGPGLPVIYRIQFTPEENQDYNHEIIVTTEREKFIIPIKCIGARAILDFPDQINFSTCPVKNLNSKVLLIRNIGNKDAKFSLNTEKPFKVSPDHGILPIGENMQVTLEFYPQKCEEYFKELLITYDSCDTLYVSLYGSAQDINVRLEKNTIELEDTYITMNNQNSITLVNHSDIIVRYEWKNYPTLAEEEHQKLRDICLLNKEEENARNKLAGVISNNQDHFALLSRNFKNKLRNVRNKPFQFQDSVFEIEPIEGEIWPQSTSTVNVIFRPNIAQAYIKTAFCEITGRESRLPLRLNGIGLGPRVDLSIEMLDIGSVFVGSIHVYEVVLANKGYIDAIFNVLVPSTTFGKCFMFEPNEGLISPGGYQVINITLKTSKLGEFEDIFEFAIDGNPEKLKLVIKGNVIPPTFTFDSPKLKFGLVSFGFKHTQSCILSNTSLVPMNFNLRVASDSKVSLNNQYDFHDDSIYTFKEFSIVPNSGQIPAQSRVKLSIEFVPHFIKKYETELLLDMDEIGLSELFSLPITARSTVPQINIITPMLDLGRCFIHHNYECLLHLKNDTPLKARYQLLPSNPDVDAIIFTSFHSEGVIEPNSIKEITIIATSTQLGDISTNLLIKINGSVEPPLQCNYICFSQGPVVQIYPKNIDWGLTTVLNDSTREITLSNESLIPAKFDIFLQKKNSVWRVEPSRGTIEPGSEIIIKAFCYLIDKIKYEDVINIDFENSHTHKVNVKAIGTGSSIVSNPNIGSLIDFGTSFCCGLVQRTFKLTNKSSRQQNLSFQIGENLRQTQTPAKKEILQKEKIKNLQQSLFKINPARIELSPGETKEITIEGFGDKPQLLDEVVYCYSIIGRTTGKDRVMKFRIRCEFIEPIVSFSTHNLLFRCEHDGVSGLPEKQIKNLTLSNISGLDLTARMNTTKPFSLIDEETGTLVQDMMIILKTGQSVHLNVNFDTRFKLDLHSEIVRGQLAINYLEHQENDYVNLISEIFFPNVHLETSTIDFGCILNNTEVQRKIKMTNFGPLIVRYKWSFLLEKNNIFFNNNLFLSHESKEKSHSQNDEPIKTNKDDTFKEFPEFKTQEKPEKLESLDSSSELSIRLKNKNNQEIALNKSIEPDMPSIEEIFDISPLYGFLDPGQSQELKVTFFGHKDIMAFVRAICHVQNGPSYEIMIKGEASVLSYELSSRLIDFGCIPFDEISEAEIEIKNIGKVSIKYSMVENEIVLDESNNIKIEPNRPIIFPLEGVIEAETTKNIAVRYWPGVPNLFKKTFQLQISHFSPEDITIQGEAGFVDIMLDLPRLDNQEYQNLKKEALQYKTSQQKDDQELTVSELELQLEIDRLSIKNFVKNTNPLLIENLTESLNDQVGPRKIADNKKEILKNEMNEIREMVRKPSSSKYEHIQVGLEKSSIIGSVTNCISSNRTDEGSSISTKKKKAVLPDYVLDFGHVILGTVKTHVIRVMNMGKLLASFEIERQNYLKTGFLIDLEKVKNLPIEETVEFQITFDPRGANLGIGPVEHNIPLNITNGPIVNIRLKANVTMPDMQISCDVVEFSEVKCGECKIITVQLNNHKEVRCDWFASYLPKKDEKFTPLHLKRMKKLNVETSKPKVFEIMPGSGILMPGQKANIQIKFMPNEEKAYEERVTIRMSQSSQRLMILCKGKGLEPRIEFSKNSLEFDPILPHSTGDEQEIKLQNPCPFPIEIYNLEFDKSYLEEEKILRIVPGYDEYNTILLPPRNAGDKLPQEFYDFYDEQLKKLEEDEKKQRQTSTTDIPLESEEIRQPIRSAGTEITKSKSEEIVSSNSNNNLQKVVGELIEQRNPVLDSIARYLGIDLSIEGRAARNRRGVAMVIHGPPLSGKSRTAVALAKHYECALLSIDTIIIDAISTSSSISAQRARQLCADAAQKCADELRALEAATAIDMNRSTGGGIIGGGLSAEALAQHTITQGGLLGGSKKTSVAGDSHSKSKKAKLAGDNSNIDQSSTHPSTPPPLQAPIARKLSISTNMYVHDEGYMSTVLPEDLIVDLLNERFQLSDCNRGVIIDGLDTLFAQNYLLAATAVLKAFNNRRYIYFVTMKSDFQKYKENMAQIQEEKMKANKEIELKEQIFLEEMDEETYNNLASEKKKEIDDKLQETKKLRLKREAEERAEKERIERELAEQQARLEEERKKKKKTVPGKETQEKKPANPTQNKATFLKDANLKEGKQTQNQLHQGPGSDKGGVSGSDRPHTRVEGGNTIQVSIEDADKGKKVTKLQLHEEDPLLKIIDPEEEKRREAERLLQQRFKTFEVHFKDICNLLEAWDRTQGNIFRQSSPSDKSELEDHTVTKRFKKDLKNKKEREKAAEAAKTAEQQKQQISNEENNEKDENQDLPTNQNDDSSRKLNEITITKEEPIGVPHIIIENVHKFDLEEFLKCPKFPPIEEVLDGMGLGRKGPPIPPPALFAVVPYPAYRKTPPGAEFSHYLFVTINENDPNLIPDDKTKESGAIFDVVIENEKVCDLNAKNKSKPPKVSSRNDSKLDGRRTSGSDTQNRRQVRSESRLKKDQPAGFGGSQSPNRISSSLSQNPNDTQDGSASIDGIGGNSSIEKTSQRLQRFRWVIMPNCEIILRIRFTSDECGQFDQTLNFEIVGTRRRYQLHCRGVCMFPSISREPRIVFNNRKKARESPKEIIQKKYVLADDVFDFGPLLIGNNRDRVREGKFLENMETLNIQNNSPLDSEVSFCFLEEGNDPCFFLEPSDLTLKPNENKQIRIYAVPKEVRQYLDTLVCCIKENPEPVTFKIACHGQKPELILDKKEFNFKQVLLHRKDSKDIKMINNTMIPVYWKIEGVDQLGEEFVCNQTNGVIEPFNMFTLVLHFRALRPIVITAKDKKILKLLVSSHNSFLGLMENHTITVTAEAYDVALEINLPKGNDGGIEFGNVRVGVETKLQCTLRNKGKYPIRFNFLTEETNSETKEALKYLSIQPASGELPSVYDRSSQNQLIQVIINPKTEINIRDEPILKCQIIESSISENNGVIANIPIKISVKAMLSKFNIIPQSEINFGAMLVNSKRQERLIIENKGEFDFKFSINKYFTDNNKNQSKEVAQNQGRLQFGVYTITPAVGIILQNGHQVITIDCSPEFAGKFEEDFIIDISDRNMQQYPNGVLYKLTSEAIFPAICNSIEIFEEHTIIPNASALDSKNMGVGIYAEEENKFFFNNVIVGRTAKARFKLLNSNKIPIDLSLNLKTSTTSTISLVPTRTPIGNRSNNNELAFDITPSRLHISPHSYAYATVIFTPTSISYYTCQFEATLENLSPLITKQRSIGFEIFGEGTLPRFSIVKPAIRNRKGQALMLFKRTVIGTEDRQNLILANEGNLAAKINFFLFDPDSAFKIRPINVANKDDPLEGIVIKEDGDSSLLASVIIQPGCESSFQVTCTPRAIQTYQGSLQITVTDNQFEDTLVQLIGEGYQEEIILDNLPSMPPLIANYLGESEASDLLADEDLAALKSNSIHFGDCYINERKQLLFTMKNTSKTQCYRFEWQELAFQGSNLTVANASLFDPNNGGLPTSTSSAIVQFSPRIGHLHAGCVKDIAVTFKSPEPKFLKNELVKCILTKISFEQPIDEIKDWDDRMHVVKWVNDVAVGQSQTIVQEATINIQNQATTLNLHGRTSQLGHTLGALSSQVNKGIDLRNSSVILVAGISNNTQIVQQNKQIIKKKVIEIEPEPKYIRSEEIFSSLELLINANCDFCRFRCRTNCIRFKDTLMFQTRTYEVSIINRGTIGFDFNWRVQIEDSRRPFTPLIPNDSPTPEDRSLSPVFGRNGIKVNKNASGIGSVAGVGDTNISSNRKMQNKDQPTKKEKSQVSTIKKGSQGGITTGRDTTVGRKSKEIKMAAQNSQEKDQPEETLTKQSMLDTSSITVKTFDQNELYSTTNALFIRPESQALMRAESALSIHSPSTIAETGYIPFSIEPAFGRCEAGKTVSCKVKFAPLNVNEYQARLFCTIENTEDGRSGPIIAVKGRGLLPYCHFELEESDYLTSGRRNPELPGPSGAASGLGLEPTTKVIEFKCVGLGNKESQSKIYRKFEIFNPTNVDYEFEWIKEEQNDGKRHDEFTCLETRGKVLSGRKFELGFIYEPDEIGIKETFWRFLIPKFQLSVPFLLVGNALEPKVIFDRAHVSFKTLLVGRTAQEKVYLINQEPRSQRFEFDQISCYTEGRSAVVLVNPSAGELPPYSRIPILLSFHAKEPRQCVFNLKCHIEGSQPHKFLNLNVKDEACSIETSLHLEDINTGQRIEFSNCNLNEIRIGEIEKNETCLRNLFLTNTGKHSIKFEWFLSSEAREVLDCYSIEPTCDVLESGDRKHFILKYVAKLETLSVCNLSLKIENGPIYHIRAQGIAVKPDLYISPSYSNFDKCFIFKSGMKAKTLVLTLTNRGQKDLNISCLTELPALSVFSYDFKQIILGPKKSTQCIVSFFPREPKIYEENLIFELNGLTKREINLRGEGTPLKLELDEPKNKLVDLGTLQIGKTSKKTIKIINKSVIPVNFKLNLEPKSEQLVKDRTILNIVPTEDIFLAPNQTHDLIVKFSPKSRIQRFVEDLNFISNGVSSHLCSIQGACLGINIWLESSTLPFGAVAQRCSTVKRIVMHNDGDIGASFKWDIEKMQPEFILFPTFGYISPGMEVYFDVTFNPTELAADIRKDGVKCIVEGLTKPLMLNLTGSCVQIIPQKETLNFEKPVRSKEKKSISITNRTNSTWELKPIIEGEYFHGLESFVVKPQSTNQYDVIYHPLSMTNNDIKQKHLGSVFFALPDGTGLAYNLTGVANSPLAIDKIQRDMPCKTSHVELLWVENWLKKAQRFRVSFESTRPDRNEANSTWSLKGNDYLDVPGNGRKDYKLTLYAHKEGKMETKIVFRNESTGEFCFYELVLHSVGNGSLGTIELFTQVRVPIGHAIRLDNPIASAATFTATCSNAAEILLPTSVTISGRSQGDFTFEYLPLRAGESQAELKLTSPELGLFVYDLKLKAVLAPHEPAIYFKTTLGQCQTINAHFNNYFRQKTDYICKVDNSDFKVDKSIAAAPSQTPSGIEVSFDIIYEPSRIGEFKSILTLTSPAGGEYVFPLNAICLAPKPQGPFQIKANSTTSIAFKNVFNQPLVFSFAIDNPLFHVNKSTELIKAHQTYKIVVGLVGSDNNASTKADVMAKLVVTAPRSAGNSNNVQWIYYLRGTY